MPAFRKFAIRVQRFQRTRGKRGKVSLISQRKITVNGKVVKPGAKVNKSSPSASQLKKTITKRK